MKPQGGTRRRRRNKEIAALTLRGWCWSPGLAAGWGGLGCGAGPGPPKSRCCSGAARRSEPCLTPPGTLWPESLDKKSLFGCLFLLTGYLTFCQCTLVVPLLSLLSAFPPVSSFLLITKFTSLLTTRKINSDERSHYTN